MPPEDGSESNDGSFYSRFRDYLLGTMGQTAEQLRPVEAQAAEETLLSPGQPPEPLAYNYFAETDPARIGQMAWPRYRSLERKKELETFVQTLDKILNNNFFQEILAQKGIQPLTLQNYLALAIRDGVSKPFFSLGKYVKADLKTQFGIDPKSPKVRSNFPGINPVLLDNILSGILNFHIQQDIYLKKLELKPPIEKDNPLFAAFMSHLGIGKFTRLWNVIAKPGDEPENYQNFVSNLATYIVEQNPHLQDGITFELNKRYGLRTLNFLQGEVSQDDKVTIAGETFEVADLKKALDGAANLDALLRVDDCVEHRAPESRLLWEEKWQYVPGMEVMRFEKAAMSISQALQQIKSDPNIQRRLSSNGIVLRDLNYYLAIAMAESSLRWWKRSTDVFGLFQIKSSACQDISSLLGAPELNCPSDIFYADEVRDRRDEQEADKSIVNNAVVGILYWHLCRDRYAKRAELIPPMEEDSQDRIAAAIYNRGKKSFEKLWAGVFQEDSDKTTPRSFKEFGIKLARMIAEKYPTIKAETREILDERYNVQCVRYYTGTLGQIPREQWFKFNEFDEESYNPQTLLNLLDYAENISSFYCMRQPT